MNMCEDEGRVVCAKKNGRCAGARKEMERKTEIQVERDSRNRDMESVGLKMVDVMERAKWKERNSKLFRRPQMIGIAQKVEVRIRKVVLLIMFYSNLINTHVHLQNLDSAAKQSETSRSAILSTFLDLDSRTVTANNDFYEKITADLREAENSNGVGRA